MNPDDMLETATIDPRAYDEFYALLAAAKAAGVARMAELTRFAQLVEHAITGETDTKVIVALTDLARKVLTP